MRKVPDWHTYFMTIAETVSLRSKDPMTNVGAILVTELKHIVGTGYNGFPAGALETEELWQRPTKYFHVKHAEINALEHSNCSNLNNITLYCTLFPCVNCMKEIVKYDIRNIYYKNVYADTSESMKLAEEHGISCHNLWQK